MIGSKIVFKSFLLLILCTILMSCNKEQPNSDDIDLSINKRSNWAPNSIDKIEKLIASNKDNPKAYVVFDFDNTCIYPDIQENLFIYQIENLLFKMTPDEFRYSVTHYTNTGLDGNLEVPENNFKRPYTNILGKMVNIKMIAEDCYSYYNYFYDNYRILNPHSKNDLSLGEIRTTNQFKDFRAKMWFVYSAIYDSFSMNVSYTWVLFVMSTGFSSEEISKFTIDASDWGIRQEVGKIYFESPLDFKSISGPVSNKMVGNYFRLGLRPTYEMGQLIKTFESNNIPVYICTASLQDVVNTTVTYPNYGYNLPANRVLGMRLKKNKNGKYISEYDRTDNYTINSGSGKTFNILKVLVDKYHANPIMIAGDSQGDYPMMTELSGVDNVAIVNDFDPVKLILIINRNKSGLISNLYRIANQQLNEKDETQTCIVLQGRDENKGLWHKSELTIKLGSKN